MQSRREATVGIGAGQSASTRAGMRALTGRRTRRASPTDVMARRESPWDAGSAGRMVRLDRRRRPDPRIRSAALSPSPRRIVSLVPSATETLFALGAGGWLVGRTRWCTRPAAGVAGLPAVGGTKDPDLDAIRALRPDLVLANAEENRAQDIAVLAAEVDVHVAFPRDVPGVLADLVALGARLASPQAADALAGRIAAQRRALRARARPFRFACAIWRAPWRFAGPDTYASALLQEAGGVNVAPPGPGRYPPLEPAALAAAAPDVVLLTSEPFPFRPGHAAELGPLAPRVRLADGQLLGWHGARTEAGLAWLRGLRLP